MGAKISRIEREVTELLELEEEGERSPTAQDGLEARPSPRDAGLQAPRT
jgi:hypothetical protein